MLIIFLLTTLWILWDDMIIELLAGSTRGWTYVTTLERALLLSLSRRNNKKHGAAQGTLGCGQTVKIVGLQGRKDLNGQCGMTARFIPTISSGSSTCSNESSAVTATTPAPAATTTGRWEVLLCNGEGVRVKPANLEASPQASFTPPALQAKTDTEADTVAEEKVETDEGGAGRVLVFWGVARWTRAQLLGEIARGHWYPPTHYTAHSQLQFASSSLSLSQYLATLPRLSSLPSTSHTLVFIYTNDYCSCDLSLLVLAPLRGLCRATAQELILKPSSVWSGKHFNSSSWLSYAVWCVLYTLYCVYSVLYIALLCYMLCALNYS